MDDQDFPPLPSQEVHKNPPKAKQSPTKAAPQKNPETTASLSGLPDELLLEILDYLPCLDLEHFQLPTLISLSLTNRRLHALVSERLYAAYNSFFCVPYLYLRTLVSSLQLAEKVRSVTFRYGPGVHSDRGRYCPSVSDKRLIKDGLKALEVPGWKSWATDCNDERFEQERLYATILMHTPNITFLDIDDGPVPYKFPKWLELIRWTVSGSGFGRMHHFSHLKSIRVEVGKLKLRHLAPLFRLQSVRQLKLIGLIESCQTKEGQPDALRRLLPANSSRIEDLSLLRSFVNSEVLAVLLKSIQQLKRFTHEHDIIGYLFKGGGEDYWTKSKAASLHPNGIPSTMPHYSNLVTALESHRHCLESLLLSEHVFEDIPRSTPGMLGSLRIFKKLAHLEAPFGAVIDVRLGSHATFVENLPSSLSTLCLDIGWDSKERKCMAALEHTAAYHQTFVHLLKEVRITARAPASDFRYDWDRLRRPLSESGVCVIVEQTTEDDDGVYVSPSATDSDSSSESDEESLYSF